MLKGSNSTLPIRFSENFIKEDDNYHVFEVNEDILNSLKERRTLQIKGPTENDDAVLTTMAKTYKLQRRLFSNSFLFTTHKTASADEDEHLEVMTLKEHLFEVILTTPRFDEVYKFLYKSRIKEDDEVDLLETGYTFEEILQRSQISEEELKTFFQKINPCNIGNRWFLVDENYLITIFHEILYELRVNKCNLEEICYPNILEEININKNKHLVLNAMQNYMEFTNVRENQLVFRLNFELVCKVFAKETLLSKDNYYWKDFKAIFRKMIETYCPRLLYDDLMEEDRERIETSCLQGFSILVDENSLNLNYYHDQKLYIKYVNGLLLPSDMKERFKALFKIKKRYFYEEMVMWLKDLVSNPKELDEILLKNTRGINEKLSKNNFVPFSNAFKPFTKNITEDKNSKGQYYDVRFYVVKY